MQYYLYKQGTLNGPLTLEKIEELKKNKKILEYQWIIDSESQSWKSLSETPKENPFNITNHNIKDRVLSAAFFIGKNAHAGNIIKMHSFGVEVLLKQQKGLIRGISELKSILVNLCDETNFTFINAKAIIQSQEMTKEGLHVRFNWDQQEVTL